MKIFTSYFSNIPEVLEECPDAFFVSIAGKTPEWFTGAKYCKLAPKASWWNEWHSKFSEHLDSDESTEWYREKYIGTVLDMTCPGIVVKDLMDISNNAKTVVLLCYERPEHFCHRQIVAFWLDIHGIECKEWSNEGKN